ncbi:endonuclease/exonuclease/phosphatase family protein [Streptomyces chiangmaiensis]
MIGMASSTPLLPNSLTEPYGSAVIRVLGYNIRSMRGDTDALARVIRACEPDVVLVQEAPASSAGARSSPGSRRPPAW